MLMGMIIERYLLNLFQSSSTIWEVWAMGVFGLRIVWNVSEFLDVGYRLQDWREDGWNDGFFQEFSKLALHLSLVLLVPMGILSLIPDGNEEFNSRKTQVIYAACLFMIISNVAGRMIGARVKSWLDSIRDEQFLVGRRLHNYASA
jgi:hypothetical protein